MVHTFTNVCNVTPANSPTYGTKNQTRSARNAPTHPRCGSTSFSQQGVSSTSLGEIAKAAGVMRGATDWHFKDKSDLFSEIWELSESNIGELELEYQENSLCDPL
ncbi:TetR family transcriptional regulator [Shigella flexneri]